MTSRLYTCIVYYFAILQFLESLIKRLLYYNSLKEIRFRLYLPPAHPLETAQMIWEQVEGISA